MEDTATDNRTAAAMMACPVCGRAGAAVPGHSAPCERCGTDLATYREAIAKAQALLRSAEASLRHDPLAGLHLAARAARLHATPEARRVQALAALCARRHTEALALYRACRG